MASEFLQGSPWGQERALVDGAPPPPMSAERPLTHSEYIDDYLLMEAGVRSDAHGLRTRMADHAGRARAHLRETGFPVHKEEFGDSVHKEEFGDSVTTLGHLVGGDPPCVVVAPPKRWLAIECCWG